MAGWLIFGWFALPPVASQDIGGLALTLIIGITGIVFSLPIGILLALGRTSNLPVIKILSVLFIEFIRGVPLIALLFIASTMQMVSPCFTSLPTSIKAAVSGDGER